MSHLYARVLAAFRSTASTSAPDLQPQAAVVRSPEMDCPVWKYRVQQEALRSCRR